MIELILGGARSGKSRLAEQRARDWQAQGRHVVYVATAQAGDAEMAARIAQHRAGRPSEWRTVEVTLTLADTLQREAAADRGIVVDCLTLWLSNLFFAGRAAAQAEAGEPIACELLDREVDALAATLPALAGNVVLVSNEIGCGMVPMNAVARAFADRQGWLNQQIAALAAPVTLVAAGLPLTLKAPAAGHGH